MSFWIPPPVFKFVSTFEHLWSLHRLLKHLLFSNILKRFYLLIFFCLPQNVVSNAKGKYLFCNWHFLLYLCSFVMFCTLTKYLYVRFHMCSVLCILVNHRFIWFVTHLTTPCSWFFKLYCTTIFVFVLYVFWVVY